MKSVVFGILFLIILVPLFDNAFAQTQTGAEDYLGMFMDKIHNYIVKLTGNANIKSDSNPVGVSSDKLKDVESHWFDTAKQLLGLAKSINNSTTTSVNDLSPVKLSGTILWILGIIITLYVLFVIIKKFWKHFLYLLVLIILVIVFFLVLGVHNLSDSSLGT